MGRACVLQGKGKPKEGNPQAISSPLKGFSALSRTRKKRNYARESPSCPRRQRLLERPNAPTESAGSEDRTSAASCRASYAQESTCLLCLVQLTQKGGPNPSESGECSTVSLSTHSVTMM